MAKLKTLEHLRAEKERAETYAELAAQSKAGYAKLKAARAEVAELQNIRKCVDIVQRAEQPERTQTKKHEQER